MKISCGVLVYRVQNNELQVFLVHPGGPFFAKKDNGYWSIPKGELNKNEEKVDCAIREFNEETSVDISNYRNKMIELGSVIQKNGKQVFAWALEYELPEIVDSNGFADLKEKSNKITINLGIKHFQAPEIDKGQFFNLENAKVKVNPNQWELIEKPKVIR